jgi:alkylation response protein AidB-like acyl-CoA dehydrogenase
MSFVLTEEQESIKTMARAFIRERMPIAHLRSLRDERDPIGFSRAAWRDMAALGLAGMIFPERFGGGGLGYAELGLVLEECGRTLAPTPFVSTVLLGANAIHLKGSDALKSDILPGVASGDRIIALAHEEGSRHARYRVATSAERVAGGYRIRGEKTFVLDGHVADTLVVVARTSGESDARAGLTLFAIPSTAPGVTVTRMTMIDSRNAARVRFDDARVTDADRVGEAGEGADVLDAILDRATVALSAEMLGGMQEAFEQTVTYLKTRKQFGVPIGSF